MGERLREHGFRVEFEEPGELFSKEAEDAYDDRALGSIQALEHAQEAANERAAQAEKARERERVGKKERKERKNQRKK